MSRELDWSSLKQRLTIIFDLVIVVCVSCAAATCCEELADGCEE